MIWTSAQADRDSPCQVPLTPWAGPLRPLTLAPDHRQADGVEAEHAEPEPFAWWNVQTAPPAPERVLRDIVQLRASLDRIEALLVERARANGSSWAEIGGLLGVTRQSAHRRHRTAAKPAATADAFARR